jgi:hypothetical protein
MTGIQSKPEEDLKFGPLWELMTAGGFSPVGPWELRDIGGKYSAHRGRPCLSEGKIPRSWGVF